VSLNISTKIKPDNVKDKFLEVTEKFLKEKNRRYFGIAAASLQNQLDDPKYEKYKPNSKIINIGISGEKTTSKVLREWIADKPECVLIDSISLPINNLEPEEDGEEGQLDLGDTDHLLIIRDNLIIIDSKNWKAKTTYQITEEKEILRGKKSFKGNRPRIQQCRELWGIYYKGMELDNIYTFVCISADENTNIIRDKNWWRVGYKLVNQNTLIYFLDKLYNEKINNPESEKFIRTELVALALTGLVKPYDKYKEKFGNVYNLAKGKS
jgi:Nuclease-related domain.